MNEKLEEERIEKYFKDKSGVLCVYLFGSIAKGKNTQYSDIETALIHRLSRRVI